MTARLPEEPRPGHTLLAALGVSAVLHVAAALVLSAAAAHWPPVSPPLLHRPLEVALVAPTPLPGPSTTAALEKPPGSLSAPEPAELPPAAGPRPEAPPAETPRPPAGLQAIAPRGPRVPGPPPDALRVQPLPGSPTLPAAAPGPSAAEALLAPPPSLLDVPVATGEPAPAPVAAAAGVGGRGLAPQPPPNPAGATRTAAGASGVRGGADALLAPPVTPVAGSRAAERPGETGGGERSGGGRAVAAMAGARGDGAASPGPGSFARPLGGYQVAPVYPESARRQRIEGTTLLKVRISDRGLVEAVEIARSAGHPDLDRAAAEAVRRWRFEPARRGAEPVAVWAMIPVRFELR